MIRYNNISLSFDGNIVLEDFNLAVNHGDKVLITGKSGKGKSTLLRLLLGFQKASSGHLLVNGQDIEHSDFYKLRQQFAYVNQDVTLRPGRVSDILHDITKFSGNEFEGRIDDQLIKLLEFDVGLFSKDTRELSGGERQRLGIMIAIMLNRPVFLLDEVTSALDENLKRQVVNYFESLDKTVLSVSHDSVWSDSEVFRKVVL